MTTAEKRSGSYSTRVSLTDPDTGERTQKRLTARTKRELDAKVADLKARWNNGTYCEPTMTTLRDYLAEWIPKAGGTEATALNRAQHVRVHIAPDSIGAVPIGRLRLSHVQDFVDRKIAGGLAVSYVRLLVTTVSHALNRAVRLRVIDYNPCQGVEYPKTRTGDDARRVLSEDETRLLVNGVSADDDAAFWVLAVTLGLRRSELIALRWSDIDFERGTVSISRTMTRDKHARWIIADAPKSEASRRTLHLPSVCLTSLRAHRPRQLERRLLLGSLWQDTGAVFDAGDGTFYRSPDRIDRRWPQLRQQFGLSAITLHGLRHTAATNALMNGMPVHVVAKMLGHSNPAITLRIYAHVLPTMEREAIARIDALFA